MTDQLIDWLNDWLIDIDGLHDERLSHYSLLMPYVVIGLGQQWIM